MRLATLFILALLPGFVLPGGAVRGEDLGRHGFVDSDGVTARTSDVVCGF